MVVKASCNDMFLVSPSSCRTHDHYICNPVTKQIVQLPAIPRLKDPSIYDPRGGIGYAFVRMPPSPTTNGRFKVVEVLPPYDYHLTLDLNIEPDIILPVTVFCSESRKWETRSFPCRGLSTYWSYNFSLEITTCNGILYWLGTSDKWKIVVYLDLSKDKCGTINIPSSGNQISAPEIGIVRVSGGLDELRLIQTVAYNAEIVPLKVWRLNNNDGDWCLVHNNKLENPKNLREASPLVGSFVHPTNGDSVFIVWGKNVIEYNSSMQRIRRSASFQRSFIRSSLSLLIWSFPMVLPNLVH